MLAPVTWLLNIKATRSWGRRSGPPGGSEARGQAGGLAGGSLLSAECVRFGNGLYAGEKMGRYQNISGAQGKEQMADIFIRKGQFGLDCCGK